MGKGRWGGICGLNSLIQRVFVNAKVIMWADFFHLHNYSRIMSYLYWTANQTPLLDQLFRLQVAFCQTVEESVL